MRNSGNILFGGILLTAGVLWLLKSLDLFHFQWTDLFGYWYWFLIAAGLLLLISGVTNNRLAGGFSGIFITLAIIGGISHGIHHEFRNLSPFSRQQEWGEKNRNGGDKRENRRERRQRLKSGEIVRGNHGYDMRSDIRTSRLNFSGGAGVFSIAGGADRLFEANTSSSFVNYVSNIRHNTADQYATIDFGMENGEIDFDNKDGDNTVNISINDSVRWDINLKFGAGEGKFDFSNNIIEKLDMNAGAADVKLKLGDRSAESKVEINAGVASIEIQVPKSAAVEIRSSGALNATEFPGFVRTEKGRYQSPDYDESKNKISIRYKAGLSSLKIESY